MDPRLPNGNVKLSEDGLKEILRKHKAWMNGEPGGNNADLRGFDLRGLDLRGFDLSGFDLRGLDLSGFDLGHADLRRADLRGADLTDIKMYSTVGNMVHIKSMFCDRYPVAYTADLLQIGCQRHRIDDWWVFDDQRIIEMGAKHALEMNRKCTLEWWRVWKPILKQAIEASPAEPTT